MLAALLILVGLLSATMTAGRPSPPARLSRAARRPDAPLPECRSDRHDGLKLRPTMLILVGMVGTVTDDLETGCR